MRRWFAAAFAVLALAGCAGSPAGGTPTAGPTTPSADGELPPVVVFLGDSYTEGTGLPDDQWRTRWATRLATDRGWLEINAGCNGSGYTRPGLRCGTDYLERIPQLAGSDPDMIIVSGGVNDLGASRVTMVDFVDRTLAELRSAFPEAQIVAVGGIFYTGDERPAALQYLNDQVARMATEVGGTYIDIGEPLLGHPELMAPDGLHPNAEGHALIAQLTERAMVEAGVLEPRAVPSLEA